MAELKTKENLASVEAFLETMADDKKRRDSHAIIKLMQGVTKFGPKMWGSSIIGFGSYHYKYASGHEGDACLVGFSPRKANISFYLFCGFKKSSELLEKLGKHKMGKGCLYIKNLDDVDQDVLKELIKASIIALKEHTESMKKGINLYAQ